MVAMVLVFLPTVHAAVITGRSSTIIEFDDAYDDTAVPVYQYILFNLNDMDSQGLNFKGYGRLATDTQDVIDADSRLYYAFIEKKNMLRNRVDARLGRQFIATTAGASLMDGLLVKLKDIGPAGFRLFGGGNATYYEDYDADDLIWGAEINGHFNNSFDLALSYVQTYEDGDLAKELFGLDFNYDIQDILTLYSEVQYNYLSDTFSYFLAGSRYYHDPKWAVRTEYLYSKPVFTSTSIYSVFAVDEYEEIMAQYTYRFALGLRAFSRFTWEMYDSFDDAHVLEAGIEKIMTDRFSGYLAGVYRKDDDGQDLKGIKGRAAYMFNKYIQAGIGANVDVLDRRIDFQNDEDETTSQRYWVYSTLFLNKKTNIQAKLERISSDLSDAYYRGRLRLNISF
jgi:hypothetical protein